MKKLSMFVLVLVVAGASFLLVLYFGKTSQKIDNPELRITHVIEEGETVEEIEEGEEAIDYSNLSLEEKIQLFTEQNFSSGYICDDIAEAQLFFQTSFVPYEWEVHTGENVYVVMFWVRGYYKTELGNLKSCGGFGRIYVVEDLEEEMVLRRFVFGVKPTDLPEDLQEMELVYPNFEEEWFSNPAKAYFEITYPEEFSQACPEFLCNQVWYGPMYNGPIYTENYDFTTTKYTALLENIEASGRRDVVEFLADGTYTAYSTREDDSSSSFDWSNQGWKRKLLNEHTLSYFANKDPERMHIFEIVSLKETEMVFNHLYQ